LLSFLGWATAATTFPDQSLRVWSVYGYLIVYRPATQPLEVLRIVNGVRHLGRIFRQ
jgi:hypothetical protein